MLTSESPQESRHALPGLVERYARDLRSVLEGHRAGEDHAGRLLGEVVLRPDGDGPRG